ncbi:zinc ABC transporter ATP-binding protein AztA [Klenkia taihuensis]|uniref:Zinc/manganese transport system ATP-binding protein n=1 Tax=Klenkia taihuensis TaxID=1225127 RepID=A0A1I1U730_9ACTN|nr:zinc ABC transporter ATP-binding protein AztA [Klenkia taihuensis]GHE07064.1 ABC transporter ATP-binding protein [Klenkia taihuensis]SFD63710.1 zinc/manganese transport system ATP-binding protein [Klenkia taihuensis]
MSPVVDLDRLCVRRGDVHALADVTARLRPGVVTALVGHNGAGKSTLLDVLAGVRPPTSGRVLGLRGRSVAYVPQRSAVPDDLPVTVGDVLAMGRWREVGPWRRLGAADRALVAQVADRLELAGLLRRPLSSVSGGQRQRALVGQGLVARADVLLVDEPTAGVDTGTREALLAAIADEAGRGALVVHATHEQAAVDRAGAVLALDAGRLAR